MRPAAETGIGTADGPVAAGSERVHRFAPDPGMSRLNDDSKLRVIVDEVPGVELADLVTAETTGRNVKPLGERSGGFILADGSDREE